MDGSEKLPLLMIDKSANPCCFKNVKSKPVAYESNKKAWMTCEFFEKWLLSINKKFGKEKREIFLFIDNCTAHNSIPEMKNVQVIFFPGNMTSVIQPMDHQNVVACSEIIDADILAQVASNSQDEDGLSGDEGGTEIKEKPLPSASEAMTHIHELRRYFEGQSNVEDCIFVSLSIRLQLVITQSLHSKKQSKISDFFKSVE